MIIRQTFCFLPAELWKISFLTFRSIWYVLYHCVPLAYFISSLMHQLTPSLHQCGSPWYSPYCEHQQSSPVHTTLSFQQLWAISHKQKLGKLHSSEWKINCTWLALIALSSINCMILFFVSLRLFAKWEIEQPKFLQNSILFVAADKGLTPSL